MRRQYCSEGLRSGYFENLRGAGFEPVWQMLANVRYPTLKEPPYPTLGGLGLLKKLWRRPPMDEHAYGS
jgi:hypothetical protein